MTRWSERQFERELSRGGQVYYVYNRVNDIADVAHQVAESGAGGLLSRMHTDR